MDTISRVRYIDRLGWIFFRYSPAHRVPDCQQSWTEVDDTGTEIERTETVPGWSEPARTTKYRAEGSRLWQLDTNGGGTWVYEGRNPRVCVSEDMTPDQVGTLMARCLGATYDPDV